MEQSLQEQILEILQSHVGRENAVKARTLAMRLGYTGRYADRPIRDAIRELRNNGHLILSSTRTPRGYYLAKDEAEWLEFRDGNLRPRALDILKTSRAMTLAAEERWGPGVQLKIPWQDIPLRG